MSVRFGRYDYAAFFAFTGYAMGSLVIPQVLVDIGKSLDFPLDAGGMGVGGFLHVCRSTTMLICLLLCGIASAKFGKRLCMGWSMILMGMGILLAAFSGNYAFLMCCILLAGAGEGVCEGVATPFVNDLHAKEPASYVSIAHSFWSVGTVMVVVVVCALSACGLHWRWLVGACGVISIAGAIPFFWPQNPASPYPEAVSQGSAIGDFGRKSFSICKSVRFWIYSLCMIIGAGAEFGLTFWSASYIQLIFKTKVAAGACGTAAIGLGMFAGRFGFGRLVPQRKIFHLLMATSLAGIPLSLCFLLLTPNSFGGQVVPQMAMLYFMLFLCGICVSPFWPSLQVYGVLRMPQLDSTLLYVFFSCMGVPGCGFFTWLIGLLGDWCGLQGAFYLIPASMAFYALALGLERLLTKSNPDAC